MAYRPRHARVACDVDVAVVERLRHHSRVRLASGSGAHRPRHAFDSAFTRSLASWWRGSGGATATPQQRRPAGNGLFVWGVPPQPRRRSYA